MEDSKCDSQDYHAILTDEEKVFIQTHKQCPDCKHGGLVGGPTAGLSRNYYCNNCGQGYNLAPWKGRIWFGERIGKKESYIGK